MDIEFVRSRFIKHFDGTTGSIYASPGRINLIGEHTDYNGGFVFPGAVDKGIMAEIKPNGTNKVCAYSIDLKDYVEFGLNEEDAPKASWARYIFGVCANDKERSRCKRFQYSICRRCSSGSWYVFSCCTRIYFCLCSE
mgnify:CR=1 FL=1